MSHLFLIRHAETDMTGRFCGHSDPSINKRGQIQVADLITRLGNMPEFDAIYCSDLQRAVDTATPIAAALRRPIYKTHDLREIYFGDWEGLTWEEIEERDPEYARNWAESFPYLPAPNGESFTHFEDRIMRTVDRLRNREPGRRAVVITHAGAMRVVLCNLLAYTQQEAYSITKAYCCSFGLEDAAAACEASQ